jgi:formate hydrogenlyase transcriptional activator
VIERAAILSKGPLLDIGDAFDSRPGPVTGTLEEVEKTHITNVLAETRWQIEGPQGAANQLGLNPSTLRGKMRKLGIEKGG